MDKFVGKVIKVRKVPLSFPVLDEAEPYKGNGSVSEKKSFAASFLLEPDNAEHAAAYAEVECEIERAIQELWAGVRPKKLLNDMCGEGNDRTNQQTGETYPGYENKLWITAKTGEDSPPVLKDKRKQDVTDKAKIRKLFYPGVIVSAAFNLYVPSGYLRICCGLRGIMSHEYGERLGGGATDKDFDDFDSDDGDVGEIEDDGL